MRFTATPIPGLVVVEQQPVRDDRGAFSRTWCRDEFAAAGLDFQPIQESLSTNLAAHTLRGLHIQKAPAEEQKLVRCTRGEVFDVAVDLRPDSPTLNRWFGLTLSAEAGNALFIPRGCAHGFLTLTEGAEVFYLIDTPYAATLASGVRWNSPLFAIDWPAQPAIMSAKDAAFGDHA